MVMVDMIRDKQAKNYLLEAETENLSKSSMTHITRKKCKHRVNTYKINYNPNSLLKLSSNGNNCYKLTEQTLSYDCYV